MSNISKIALALQMLESSEASIRSAKQVLKELTGENSNTNLSESFINTAEKLTVSEQAGSGRIVEGVFDGQNMIGADKRSYPVPANYASKSKLIPGDVLKLTITDNGSFLYKQIGPVPRRKVIGILSYEDGKYKVMAEGTVYRVLLASVTYFKAEVGDRVTLIVPEMEDSEWGAIENVVVTNEDNVSIDELDDNLELDIDELKEEMEEEEEEEIKKPKKKKKKEE